ncbi:MAG: YHS domain-containing protein [Desulfobacterales bacterium]|nr:YHS domain-containing protein [Desulfobacterales bacterium]
MNSHKATVIFFMGFSIVLFLLAGSGCKATGKTAGDDLAIKGYDTVAYFNSGQAVKGSAAFTFQWHAMTWHFATQENRDLFAAGPEKFAPQYDGYCAWAMAEARKAQTDPEVWKIVDGKLYLNCSRAAYEKWSKDIPGNIEKADANWLKYSDKN